MTHRICTRCKMSKALSEFKRHSNYRLSKHCTACIDAYRKREGGFDRTAYMTDFHLKRLYGISLEERNQLAANQGNKCAICLGEKPLQVDHCHTTNKIRGLLCLPCNTAIGKLKESEDIMMRAIEYLKKGT